MTDYIYVPGAELAEDEELEEEEGAAQEPEE